MKSRDADILIAPGLGGGQDPTQKGTTIWYRRWSDNLDTVFVVEQDDWSRPKIAPWGGRLKEAIAVSDRPVILIAHCAGTITVAHAFAEMSDPGKVKGAFLVAPPDLLERADSVPSLKSLAPTPSAPLPFPSMLIASRSDPYCSFKAALDMGLDWGSVVVDAGDAGHFNTDSGHGPWPEGLMMFSRFINQL